MPRSPIHEKKKAKNYTLLAILVGVIVMFFVLAMVKVKFLMGG